MLSRGVHPLMADAVHIPDEAEVRARWGAFAWTKENAEKAKALRLAKLAAKYDSELINLAAAKKRNSGNAGILDRLGDLTTLATANAGLTASQAATVGTGSTITNVVVQGSVITQQELTAIIAQELKLAQSRNGYGQWGGGL